MATIREIIDLVDKEKPNPYTDEEKIQWLINCEMQVSKDIFKAESAVFFKQKTAYEILA